MSVSTDVWSVIWMMLPHWLPHGIVAVIGLILGSLWLTRAPRPAAMLLAGCGLQLLCMGGSISLMMLSLGSSGASWMGLANWGQYGLSLVGAVCDALIVAAVLIDRTPRFAPPSEEAAGTVSPG